MNDLVERVTRQVCPFLRDGEDCDCEPRVETDYGAGMRGCYMLAEEVARAVFKEILDAMEEPSEAMDDAGIDDPNAGYCDQCMHSGHERNSGWPSLIWKAMLAQFRKEVLGDE